MISRFGYVGIIINLIIFILVPNNLFLSVACQLILKDREQAVLSLEVVEVFAKSFCSLLSKYFTALIREGNLKLTEIFDLEYNLKPE